VETLLKTHAGIQAYWEALAIRLRNRCEVFESVWVKKWWAHNKLYARHVLAAYGDNKPTVEAIKDMTLLVYSQDVSVVERDKFLNLAYTEFSNRKSASIMRSKEDFETEMYRYTRMEPAWYFETLMQTSRKLSEDYELVQVVAKKLDSRSYHVGDLIGLLKAKKWNIGPLGIADRERALMDSASRCITSAQAQKEEV
jgi:hypothetical protein